MRTSTATTFERPCENFWADLSALDGLLQFQLARPGKAQGFAFFLFFDLGHIRVDTVTPLRPPLGGACDEPLTTDRLPA